MLFPNLGNAKRLIATLICGAIVLTCGVMIGRFTQSTAGSSIPLREGGYQYIKPLLLCTTGDALDANIDSALSKQIEGYVAASHTDTGVYYLNLSTGKWAGFNENESFSPASMLKVPAMVAVLKYAESDASFLHKSVYYDGSFDDNQYEYFKPTRALEPGHSYTVEQLLTYMIGYSDNNAVRLLHDQIDISTLTNIYINLGVQIPTPQDNQIDFMSPETYSLFLRVLYNSTYLNRDMSEKALSLMALPDFPQGITSGVPASVQVAQKYGERQVTSSDGVVEERELHDCGIVYAPQNPYILCVMTRGTDFSSLTTILHDVSNLVYSYVAKK